MSIHFHPLRIKEIRKETPDCVSVLFDVPPDLEAEFQFIQGQSLTMRRLINNEEVRRTYSICSSPLEKELRVAIKKVQGGLFSSFANDQLRKGDVLDVMSPMGNFHTSLRADQKKEYLAFAAGSGITPVISLIKTTLQTEPLSKFTLVFGNRSRSHIIFFEELEGLKNLFMERFTLIHILSGERTDTPLNFGRIDADKLLDLGKLIDYSSIHEFFICGPEEMIFTAKAFLEAAGVDRTKIHFELFTTPGQHRMTERAGSATEVSGPQCQVTVKVDGRSFDFDLPLNSPLAILDAGLQKGVDLPFACKGGVCSTCRAKLLEGEVSMDVHWGLEEDEIAKGFILTCQSHPKTARVVVDYDAM